MKSTYQFARLAILVSVSLTSAVSAQAGGYRLAPVSKVQVSDSAVQLTFGLPCRSVDFESFVLGYDDSGDREVSVGVVVACEEAPVWGVFHRTLTSDSAEFAQFQEYARSGATFVPMVVAN